MHKSYTIIEDGELSWLLESNEEINPDLGYYSFNEAKERVSSIFQSFLNQYQKALSQLEDATPESVKEDTEQYHRTWQKIINDKEYWNG